MKIDISFEQKIYNYIFIKEFVLDNLLRNVFIFLIN